jgi:hypothetical protein
MNRPTDIERVLEAWFLDGPMEMPDRLFDGVLDRVERAPQRRLARLHLRFTDMSPQLRLFAGAAAVVVVAGIGVGLFGGLRGNEIGVTPTLSPAPTISATPSPSSSTAAGTVPAALQHAWIGGPRDVAGLDPHSRLAGMRIVFGPSSFAMSRSNAWDNVELQSVASATGPSRVELRSPGSSVNCRAGDTGSYQWAVSAEGRSLTLTADGDTCGSRGTAAAGTWLLVDCPAEDDGCLGPLAPGRYPSQYFDPFVLAGGNWAPRYNAISYQVPAGWSNTADWPTQFTLQRQGTTTDDGIHAWSQVTAVSEQARCDQSPDPNVSPSANAISDYLAHAPGLVATAKSPVTIGGLSGFRMDVSMDPSWTTTCPFSNGQPIRMIFTSQAPGSDFSWALSPGMKSRLWILDLGNAGAMVVDAEGETQAAFDAIADEATTIVESFQINR